VTFCRCVHCIDALLGLIYEVHRAIGRCMLIRGVVYVPRRAQAVNPQGRSRSFVIGLYLSCKQSKTIAVLHRVEDYIAALLCAFPSSSYTSSSYSQWPLTKPHRPTASHSQRRGNRRRMEPRRAAGRSRVVCHEEISTSSVCDTSHCITTTPALTY
jgi:hypothetical protein